MLEKVLAPSRPGRTLHWIWAFPMDNHHSHGKYGYQKVIVSLDTYKPYDYEAIPEEEELRLMKEYYDTQLPEHSKRDFPASHGIAAYSWKTFKDYVKSHRCRCGYHKLEWLREDNNGVR